MVAVFGSAHGRVLASASVALALAMSLALAGCGGGGEAPQPSFPDFPATPLTQAIGDFVRLSGIPVATFVVTPVLEVTPANYEAATTQLLSASKWTPLAFPTPFRVWTTAEAFPDTQARAEFESAYRRFLASGCLRVGDRLQRVDFTPQTGAPFSTLAVTDGADNYRFEPLSWGYPVRTVVATGAAVGLPDAASDRARPRQDGGREAVSGYNSVLAPIYSFSVRAVVSGNCDSGCKCVAIGSIRVQFPWKYVNYSAKCDRSSFTTTCKATATATLVLMEKSVIVTWLSPPIEVYDTGVCPSGSEGHT